MPEKMRIEVADESLTGRLDQVLVSQLDGPTRSTIQRWIKSGHVLVNARISKPSQKLNLGDWIQVEPQPAPPSELIPEEIPIDVLFEDQCLLAINKPAGMVVHPGAGNHAGTLANALLHHFNQISRASSLRPGIVHRLDKDTSGVMVVAKDDQTHQALSTQFKQRSIQKRYLALVHGSPTNQEATIDLPLGRDIRDRTKISGRSRSLRNATTHYRVLVRFQHFSYLEAFPETGRTHQIRVHLSSIGHPIVGDKRYTTARWRGLLSTLAPLNLKRHFLHANQLQIRHPRSGHPLQLTAPLPNELEDLLVSLE